MMVTHRLKLDPRYVERIISGQKTFEIRKNDRDYQVGDRLSMYPYHKRVTFYYPGMEKQNIEADIVYISTYEQQEDVCVLGIKVVEVIS